MGADLFGKFHLGAVSSFPGVWVQVSRFNSSRNISKVLEKDQDLI